MVGILIVSAVTLAVWAARAWARRCAHSWHPWRADYYLDPITQTRQPFEWRICEHCRRVQTRVDVQ